MFGPPTPTGVLLGVVLPEFVFDTLRIVAAGLGAVAGWFVAAPFMRVISKVFFRKSLPEGGQLLARIGGATSAALLIYYFLPLLPGWGGGTGPGGPGDKGGYAGNNGTDKGKGKSPSGNSDPKNNNKNGKTDGSPGEKNRLTIEVLGGKRFEDAGMKPYLLHRKEPKTLGEVKEYLEKNQDDVKQIQIVLPRDIKESFKRELEDMLIKDFMDKAGKPRFPFLFLDERKKSVSRETMVEPQLDIVNRCVGPVASVS